ncbi:MAG: hypothetical protein R3C14_03245 [Caldilineaceae bacterium]
MQQLIQEAQTLIQSAQACCHEVVELLNISHICLASAAQLQYEQWGALAESLSLLAHEQLTMADAAAADRHLLAHKLNAFFPVHGDLVNLYER